MWLVITAVCLVVAFASSHLSDNTGRKVSPRIRDVATIVAVLSTAGVIISLMMFGVSQLLLSEKNDALVRKSVAQHRKLNEAATIIWNREHCVVVSEGQTLHPDLVKFPKVVSRTTHGFEVTTYASWAELGFPDGRTIRVLSGRFENCKFTE